MFKKIAIAAPLALLALSSSVTYAADSASHTIQLEARVPAKDFYVIPTNPDLVNKTQPMHYNPSTGELDEVAGTFEMLHTGGHIESSLTSPAVLQSGADKIPVEVSLNNVVLSLTPSMTVEDDPSNTNFRAQFKAKALVKGVDAKAGEYTGSISMVHDAVVR